MRARENVPPAIELALHSSDDVARVAVEGQVVRRGKEKPLGAVAFDAEVMEQRRVGGRVEEVPEGDHLLVLEAPGRVEAIPPLGERDAYGARGRPSLEAGHELARARVVRQEMAPGDHRARPAGGPHPEREEARARDHARSGEGRREAAGARIRHDDELDGSTVSRPSRRRVEDEEPGGSGQRHEPAHDGEGDAEAVRQGLRGLPALGIEYRSGRRIPRRTAVWTLGTPSSGSLALVPAVALALAPRSCPGSRPLSPGLARVEPRLENRTRRRFVDVRSSLLSAYLAGCERSLRLYRRETLVPELDGAPRAIGDELGEPTRIARRGPLASAQVKRQADDEPPDVFADRELPKGCGERLRIAGVEGSPRVREEAELVVDGPRRCAPCPDRARRRGPDDAAGPA